MCLHGSAWFYSPLLHQPRTQYDLAPVYNADTNGSGQTIGIIGTQNLNIAEVDSYRKLFGLAGDLTQVIVDGEDPGDGITPNIEGYLDVEVSGAVAPAANINFCIAAGSPFRTHWRSPLCVPLRTTRLRCSVSAMASASSCSGRPETSYGTDSGSKPRHRDRLCSCPVEIRARPHVRWG